MAKNLSFDTLVKENNKMYSQQKKVEVGGFKNILIDKVFRPTKINALFDDYVETLLYVNKHNTKHNLVKLFGYYVIKYFSSVGNMFFEEIELRQKNSEDKDADHLIGIKVVCDLESLDLLIDMKLYDSLLEEFDKEKMEYMFVDLADKIKTASNNLSYALEQKEQKENADIQGSTESV